MSQFVENEVAFSVNKSSNGSFIGEQMLSHSNTPLHIPQQNQNRQRSYSTSSAALEDESSSDNDSNFDASSDANSMAAMDPHVEETMKHEDLLSQGHAKDRVEMHSIVMTFDDTESVKTLDT